MSLKGPDGPDFLTSIFYRGTSYILIYINDENMMYGGGGEGLTVIES